MHRHRRTSQPSCCWKCIATMFDFKDARRLADFSSVFDLTCQRAITRFLKGCESSAIRLCGQPAESRFQCLQAPSIPVLPMDSAWLYRLGRMARHRLEGAWAVLDARQATAG